MKNKVFTNKELQKFKEAFKEQERTGYDKDLVNKDSSAPCIPPSLVFSLLNQSCQKDYLQNILPDLKAYFFDNNPELTEKYLKWLGGYYEELLQSPYYDPNAPVQEFEVQDDLTTEEVEWLNSIFLSGQNNEEIPE